MTPGIPFGSSPLFQPRTHMKTNSPTHEDIARRAHEIWNARGNPGGCDIGHWLEAERELAIAAIGAQPSESQPPTPSAAPPAAAHSHATGAVAPSPDELAAKAAQQKQAARSPQLQHGHNAPKAAPTESGKPLWDKPHSS
jgi:hypothetical protein